MTVRTLRIKRGAVYKITVAATTATIVSSAGVWTLYDNREQTLKATLSAGEELILGPYINITNFRIETIGTVTVEEMGDDFADPTLLFAHQDIITGLYGLITAFLSTNGQVSLNLPADENLFIDGATNERLSTLGATLQFHTPAITGTRARRIVIKTNGQADTSVDVVEYNSEGLVTGDSGNGYQVNVNTLGSTGGTINAFGVERVQNGDSVVRALHVGTTVDPIHQNSGAAKTIEQAFTYDGSFTDVTAAFNSTGTDVEMFIGDGDIVYIGDDLQFSIITFLLVIKASNPGVKPSFEYWNGSAWTSFGPNDDTNGYRIDGNIRWIAAELIGWTPNDVNSVTKYWIRIIRNTNNLSTVPTEDIVTVTVPKVLSWNQDGDINANALILSKAATGGIKVDNVDPTFGWKDIIGDIVPKASGANTPAMSAFIGNVRTWAYNTNDVMDMVFHIPHDYVLGTDLFIHVHWSHNGTAISGSFVNTYEHSYAKSHNQEIYVATKTITQTINTPDIATIPQYMHRLDEVQLSISGGNATLMDSDDLEPDGVIVILFKPTTIPTITGGSPNNFPRITQIDLHYQATNITTKNKVPNFYV